jgi:hypothetical protein
MRYLTMLTLAAALLLTAVSASQACGFNQSASTGSNATTADNGGTPPPPPPASSTTGS